MYSILIPFYTLCETYISKVWEIKATDKQHTRVLKVLEATLLLILGCTLYCRRCWGNSGKTLSTELSTAEWITVFWNTY